MTEEKQNEMAVWEPSKFEGSDLLPTQLVHPMDTTGRENIESEDLLLPQLKVLQGTSDEVSQEMDGAKPGIFWHTAALEPIEPPVRVLAFHQFYSRALLPNEKDPGYQGLEQCISRDAQQGSVYGLCAACPHKEWRGDDGKKPPLCSKSINFAVMTVYGPAIIRFAKTSFKAGRNLLSTWGMSPWPLFAHPLILSVQKASAMVDGRTQTFYTLAGKFAMRETVPAPAQGAAKQMYEQISSAHEQGRLGSTEDEKGTGFDDIPIG